MNKKFQLRKWSSSAELNYVGTFTAEEVLDLEKNQKKGFSDWVQNSKINDTYRLFNGTYWIVVEVV